MKKFQAQAHFGRLPLSVIFCLLFLQTAQASQNRPNPDPKDIFQKLVDSAAAVIYNFAWPTATYKSCELVEVKLVSSGFDIVVKLSGLSGFDGSNLWIVLDFPFRNGDLQKFWVVKHNGNWPPFVTVGAMFKAGQALWKQYAPPPDEAGAVCLMNPTNSTLVFQYRWGDDGPWQEAKVEAGTNRWFWWPYEQAGQRFSPPFEIRYDDSFEEGYTEQKYTLERNAAKLPATCEAAKQYRFSLIGPKVILQRMN